MALDKAICVIGSVDGVKTAPTIVEPRITYFQTLNICFAEIIFVNPRIS
jgi:hypothetical protein